MSIWKDTVFEVRKCVTLKLQNRLGLGYGDEYECGRRLYTVRGSMAAVGVDLISSLLYQYWEHGLDLGSLGKQYGPRHR